MVFKPYFCAFLFISFSLPMHAISSFAHTKQEVFQFAQQARINNRDLQEGKPVTALVAHFQNPHNYIRIKDMLTLDQQAALLQAADRCDDALTIVDPIARNKEINASLRNLDQVMGAIFHESFGGAHKIARVEPKKVPAQKAAGAQSKKLHPFDSSLNDEALMNRMRELSHGNGFMSYLSENKWNIILGIAALYTLVARANDWAPFERELDEHEEEMVSVAAEGSVDVDASAENEAQSAPEGASLFERARRAFSAVLQ